MRNLKPLTHFATLSVIHMIRISNPMIGQNNRMTAESTSFRESRDGESGELFVAVGKNLPRPRPEQDLENIKMAD